MKTITRKPGWPKGTRYAYRYADSKEYFTAHWLDSMASCSCYDCAASKVRLRKIVGPKKTTKPRKETK